MAGFRGLERPAYWSGELLTAGDFRLAQDYVRLRQRNRGAVMRIPSASRR